MSESVTVQCPFCHAAISVPNQPGQSVGCPQCGQAFQVAPAAGAAPGPIGYAGRIDQPPMSGMAIASLVLGIPLCIPLFSVLALIFGIIGINQTGPGKSRGRGIAIAGTILGGVGLVLLPLSIAILLPSLNKARETANRAKCASNMHQIGLAILLYQQDNGQAYPPDLPTLCATEQLGTAVLVCPSSTDTPAATPAQVTSGGHLSYTYVPPPASTPAGPNTPVVWEKATDHANDGTNILFGDGHVSWFTTASAKSILAPYGW